MLGAVPSKNNPNLDRSIAMLQGMLLPVKMSLLKVKDRMEG